MALATTWVLYNNDTPFDVANLDAPYLDGGDYTAGTWGVSGGAAIKKFVFGLRFQGCPVNDILLWMDSEEADLYNSDGTVKALRAKMISVEGFKFRFMVINAHEDSNVVDLSSNPLSHTTSLANYHADPVTAWFDIPTTHGSAYNIGNAALDNHLEATSNPVGFSIFVPSSYANCEVRNMRLLAEYDTAD